MKRSEAIELSELLEGLVNEVNEVDTGMITKGGELVLNLKNIFLSSDKSGFFPNLFDTLKKKIMLFTNLLKNLVNTRKRRSFNTDLQNHLTLH